MDAEHGSQKTHPVAGYIFGIILAGIPVFYVWFRRGRGVTEA